MKVRTALAALALLTGACASPASTATDEGATSSTTKAPGAVTTVEERHGVEIDRPPDVVVRGAGMTLSLQPWTACWGNGCFDGAPPARPPEIGDAEEVIVVFPERGWNFVATAQATNDECGRRQTEPLQRVDATTHRLVPIGLAGEQNVTLFGRGPGGDLFVTFIWTTPSDGVMPVPAATASILADHDGRIDSYGVEVSIWDLAATPDTAAGTVTVTSSERATHTFDLVRTGFDCSEGTLYFTAPTDEGITAARMGTPPFGYEVTLQLDGETFTGTAVWPEDVDPECEPCVRLRFDPELPSLSTRPP